MTLLELWEKHPEMVRPGLKIRSGVHGDVLIEQLTSVPVHHNDDVTLPSGFMFNTVTLYCSWDKTLEGTIDRWYIDDDWDVILEIEGLEI